MAAPSGAMLLHYKNKSEANLQRKRFRQPIDYPVLHDYVILDRLGRGAFGEVRLALNINTMDRVAVKVIVKDLARRKTSAANVRREVRIMQQLRHPNIVRLIDVYSTRTKIFMMMELITGGELFHEVKHYGRLPEPYARFFFQQLVRGLDFCHSRGIYHRDLKLDNLLLDSDKTLKITDFGLSFMHDDLNPNPEIMLHTPVGTPNYIAPEVVTRIPGGYEGNKADVWSCGCILYVMVVGSLPFDGASLVDIFRQVAGGAVNYPRYLSSDLIDLLDSIFECDPKERFSLDQISWHSWFNGPVCTSMPGDDRSVNTISQMSDNIQHVVKSYMSYKETSAAQKIGVNVPVQVHPSAGATPLTLMPSDRKLNYTEKGNIYDSLAIGWLNESMESGFNLSGYHPAANASATIANARTSGRLSPVARDISSKPPSVSFAMSMKFHETSQARTKLADPPPISAKANTAGFPRSKTNEAIVANHLQDATGATTEVFVKPRPSFSSERTESSTGSGELICSDKHTSKVENLKDLAPYTKSNFTGQTLRRLLSNGAFGSHHARSQCAVREYYASNVEKSQRVRIELWNNFASEMRGESNNTLPSISTNFDPSNLSLSADLQRGELVKSKSFEGRIDIKSSRKRPRNKDEREVHFPYSDTATASSSATIAASSRKGQNFNVQEPSHLSIESSVRYEKGSSIKAERVELFSATTHTLEPKQVQNQHLWGKLMRDFDMIPDLEEFGMDSKRLEANWAQGLKQEDFAQSPSTPVVNMKRSHLELLQQQRAQHNFKGWKPMQNVHMTKMQIRPPNKGPLSLVQLLPAKLEVRGVYTGDLLTQNCVPVKILRSFIEKTGFCLEESEPEHEDPKYSKRRSVEIEKYYQSIIEKTLGKQKKLSGLVSLSNIPNEQSLPSWSLDDVSMAMSSSPLMHGLAMESIIARVNFFGNDENRTVKKSLVSNADSAPQKQGTTVVMVGPLHEDYNRAGDPAVPRSSEADQHKNDDECRVRKRTQSEMLHIFQYKIRGPKIVPRLPQATPFGRIFRPVLQAGKRLIPSPMHLLPIRKPLTLRSLFNVKQCSDIIQKLLTRDGFEVSNIRSSGSAKTKLRATICSDRLKLGIVVQVRSMSAKLTGMEFKRLSGNHISFISFFDSLQDKYAAQARSVPYEYK